MRKPEKYIPDPFTREREEEINYGVEDKPNYWEI